MRRGGDDGEIPPLKWISMAVLGETDASGITKQDLLSSIAFDKHGDFLAVGDRGGRIICFQKTMEGGQLEIDYLTEFQSHEVLFDPLHSTQIPEKINAIEWINKYKQSKPMLLSANDKLIKLWKIAYRKEKKYESCKKMLSKGKFALPRSKVLSEQWEGRCRSQYKSAHEYHINSLSLNSDGEQFLSADDLRINIWNIDDPTTVYNVLDLKPESLDELDEVITKCEFHPDNQNLLVYGTSKGFIHMCDIRQRSSFQGFSSIKIQVGHDKKKSLFSDLITSISSVKFMAQTQHQICSRDYLWLRTWDVRYAGGNNQHLNAYYTCDFVDKNLCNLYEDDSIYDKFFMDVSPCNNYFLTGNYNRSAHIVDRNGTYNSTIVANLEQAPGKRVSKDRRYTDKKKLPAFDSAGKEDYKKKVMHGAWSPADNLLALAFRNCICLQVAKK